MNIAQTSLSEQKVIVGAGLRRCIPQELSALGCSRALVITTPEQSGQALEMSEILGTKVAGVYSRAAMHTPMDVTEDAVAHAASIYADCTVAIGGGSTTGLSKALALRTDLPQFVIPTTYAGSEATPILGQTEDGVKTTLSDPRVLPEVVIYDPELVVTLPAGLSATSGLNAMAHAVEALYAKDRSAETTRLAISGLEEFTSSLQQVIATPDDLTAREATLRGAWACGHVLGRVGMALHHKLCHTLGGSFGLPHAQTHAIVLPHATHYNAAEVPDLLAPVIRILGGTEPGAALWDFARSVSSPMALKDLGLKESDLDRATGIALSKPYWNPREITTDSIRALLQNAWSGKAPGN